MANSPDDLTVDAAKFDRILSRMLTAKPLSKAEISARIKANRAGKISPEKAKDLREKARIYKSKKLGQ